MIKVILIGALGKMGRVLGEVINKEKDMQIIYGIEKENHPDLNKHFYDGYLLSKLEKVINECDICVEFTNPQATLEHLEIIKKAKKPFLIGTTGFTKEEMEILKSAGKEIPLLYSSNYSFGINFIFKILKEIIKILPDNYDITLIETHHKEKKDAPSGTAKRMVEIIKERKDKEIKTISLRFGDIIGKHTLIFATNGEVIEITHNALSRFAFANGVIYGIRFLIKQKSGFYLFEEII
ncbi:MAG: 4-hydroxy-tetrahydrodipicolinate reductase [candidate division WOR-3 bacterium]|uniref:4-hydroxy-tetrahydrodipicolinate reductase n=1 Tax=candidate division WOR-3 bacterium TaxID=2052148 RepID=A0A7C4S1H2_UNCW3